MKDQSVFDLLPFLRLRFGRILKHGLESVNLVFAPEMLYLETTERDANCRRMVSFEPGALGLNEEVVAPHEIVRAYLELDEYDWAVVGDIFPKETAQMIAEEFEANRPDLST
jgi:hypothetical protein